MTAAPHTLAEQADANNRYMRITIECPHCGTRCVACDSRAMSDTMREITYRCRSWKCGFEVRKNAAVFSVCRPGPSLATSGGKHQ